jgi:acyl carrier protein
MTTIKQLLIAAIQNTPEPILQQTLDYLEYLKTKTNTSSIKLSGISVKDGEPILRGCKAKDLLKFAGTWQGDDFEKCLQPLSYEKTNHDLESGDILVARVKKVISEQLSIEVDNISLHHSIFLGQCFNIGFSLLSSDNYDLPYNDLGVDQLDAVELLRAIKEEFNLEISDAEAEIIRTVQELVNFISSQLN